MDGTGQIYIDGVLDSSQAAAPVTLDSGLHVYIGEDVRDAYYYGPGGANSFLGQIDEVRIYNNPLTPGEIGLLYNNTNLTTDQRDEPRSVGSGVDIGAAEYQYDLAIIGSTSAQVGANNTITYNFTVTNNGSDSVTGVSLTDVLPSSVTFQSFTAPTGWTVRTPTVGQPGTVTATNSGPLAPGASAVFSLVVQANVTTEGAVIANTASVTPTANDSNSSNNSVTLSSTAPSMPPAGVDIHGQPINASVGQSIDPIVVAVVDANGNTIPTNNSQLVTLSIWSGPPGAKLEGTTTVRAVKGVATFNDLSLNMPGTYTLTATGGTLAPDYSNPFTVSGVSFPPPSPAPLMPTLSEPPLLEFLNQFLAGIEALNVDGTVTVTDSFSGVPLLVSTFDPSGQLESVTFLGINVTFLFDR